MTPERFGAMLRKARLSAGLSLAQVGRLSDFTAQTVGSWEFGHVNPTVPKVMKLMELYRKHGGEIALAFVKEVRRDV